MAVTVFTNGIDSRDQIAVQRGVEAALGGREGNWEAHITCDSLASTWSLLLTGPQFKFERIFSGTEEEDIAALVKNLVERVLIEN
jgi:hypothetical protein